MAATRSAHGGAAQEALPLEEREEEEEEEEGRMPLRRSGSPFPSLKRERTSSERGSPGRSQPR